MNLHIIHNDIENSFFLYDLDNVKKYPPIELNNIFHQLNFFWNPNFSWGTNDSDKLIKLCNYLFNLNINVKIDKQTYDLMILKLTEKFETFKNKIYNATLHNSDKFVDCYIGSSIVIELNQLTNEMLQIIKDDLTVHYYDYDDKPQLKLFYRIANNKIFLPRFYYNDKIIFNITKDFTTDGDDIDILQNDDFILREDKNEVLNEIKKYNNGIIQLHTGFGKTVLAVKYITDIKKKTLIIVDREILVNQWKKIILNLSNIKEEDISIYQSGKNNLDKPIVIAMVQTIVSKLKNNHNDVIKEFREANFGITFVDEVHSIIGPEAYTSSRYILFSKRLFSLSATPFRTNSVETKLIRYCFGDVIVSKVHTLLPKINYIEFKNNLKPDTYKYLRFGGKFNYVKYSTQLILHDDNFLELFLKKLIEINESTKYKILIPFVSIKTINHISEIINSDEKYISLRNHAILISATKNSIDKDAKIIFSTIGLINKGYDNEDIEILFLLFPLGSNQTFLEQLCGRILRFKEDKNNMKIIDFIDTSYNEVKNTAKSRYKVYNQLKFEIPEIPETLKDVILNHKIKE